MTPPSIHGPQWDRDEAYRQSVIRKALLLGFSAEEYEERLMVFGGDTITRWRFTHEGKRREHYASCYSAAWEYLRLLKCEHLAGDYRG